MIYVINIVCFIYPMAEDIARVKLGVFKMLYIVQVGVDADGEETKRAD